ncbi:SH3 domain-containing protein [Cavenderia fasciculata]|uniref:SH3 domain-containing protein n=1 Tax=Cavenderia fasciculata TaxID=261658 RepID=F4PQW5_CACFS|nr:SH3 domain-containing protein [Cavenderia fasciculata]EGG21230.1 SH3 domain-containing protein [Cavenderia fasciculata]|eukprot:XP_004359080.1 SH3 domain-containing protein [Cavenderia fasciculata]
MSRLFVTAGSWKPVHDTVAVAIHSFQANGENQLTLKVGDQIKVEEKNGEWYRGVVLTSNYLLDNIDQAVTATTTIPQQPIGASGIFPATYVVLKNTQDFDVVTNELSQVIREWGLLLITYFRERKMSEYKIMKDRLSLLLDWHAKIMSPSITLEVREMLKGKVISKIEEGRRLMGLDMIVRTANGEPAHESNTGIISLYRMHQELDTSKVSAYNNTRQLTSQTFASSSTKDLLNGASGPGSPIPATSLINAATAAAAGATGGSSSSGSSPSSTSPMSPGRKPTSNTLSGSSSGGSPSPVRAGMRKSMMVRRETGDLAAAAAAASSASSSLQPNHIFFDLKVFMCSVGEETQLFFSIYNRTEGRFITEEYQVGLTALGMPHDVDKIGKLSTLFVDVSKKELQADLYLVCRLVRKGKMLVDGKKTGPLPYRRPFGCSVLRIDDNITVGRELVHTIPIYTSTQESVFPILHEMIIKNATNLQQVPKAKGICIGLTLLPGELKQVIKENPVLEEVQQTSKLGFPDVIYPGDQRNDLFITLESGEYSQDRKTSAKNVEIIVQARLENGDLVKDCLFTGDKHRSEYKSIVFYHSNQPHWSETIKINVPLQLLDQIYLVFSIRHCTTSETKERIPFGMSYLKLTNQDGTVIGNKTHSLVSYKTTKTIEEFIPSLKDPQNKLVPRSKGEQTKVKVLLCSTVCTQNLSLLTLLKWDQYNGDLGEVLNRFTFVDQIEIIKFMQETFNALFAILEAKKVSDPDLVFSVITWIIGLLVDEKTSKYTNFKPVLDMYIENHFTSSVAHNLLIGSLKRILSNNSNLKTLLSTLKSMEYILKFIVISKRNHDLIDKSVGYSKTFKEDLTSVFSTLSQLMKKTEREYIGAQTIALKIFSSMFSDLGQLFSIEERSEIAKNFIDSVRFDESLRLLNMEKMNVILKLTEGDLFLQNSSRTLLMDTVKKHLKQHMASSTNGFDDIKKQAEIISVMIDTIQTKLKDNSKIWDIVDMLPEIVESIKSCPLHFDIAKLDMVHNLYSILYLMDEALFDRYMQSLQPQQWWSNLFKLLRVLNSLLQENAVTYPENWLTLTMFQYSTVKKVIIQVSKYLLRKLQTKIQMQQWQQIDFDLWSIFFTLSITFVKLKGLALEHFSEAKQKTIKSRYGDMRNDLISTIQTMWESLEKYQIKLLPTVIAPFLELMFINQQNLKQLGIQLYYQLLRCEFKEHKSFKKVETETINTLDQITNTEAADILDEKFRIFFSSNLEEKMNNDMIIKDSGLIFIKDMKMFLELLFALRTLPDRAEYEDDRTIACMQLMNYLKQTDRQDTYIKYVHLLCNQHLTNNNYTEAGNTLLLHADLLEWSDTVVDELQFVEGFKSQSMRERKEKLYKLSIEYLDKGKAWERAITLMKKLIIQYEEVQFDYQRLADILQQESTFYRKIIGVERFFSEYFRVGYYGKGFEPSIRGKEFIYKGYELERMSDFVQRIQAKFPSASLLTYTELPPAEIMNSPNQYLQIYAVKPSQDLQQQLPANPRHTTVLANSINNNNVNHLSPSQRSKPSTPSGSPGSMSPALLSTGATATTATVPVATKPIPPAVQKYRQHNNINTFLYSKPFRKNKTGNEFGDLWIINNYYILQDSFPTIHRRSEIVRRYEVELSPIDNAVNSVMSKNTELNEMSIKHENGNDTNISPFTMILKGVIDAAVNGGVNMYKQVFFSKEYLVDNPDKKETVDRLKSALSQQVIILEKSLAIHAKVCSLEMGGLQEQLEKQLDKMKQEMTTFVQQQQQENI